MFVKIIYRHFVFNQEKYQVCKFRIYRHFVKSVNGSNFPVFLLVYLPRSFKRHQYRPLFLILQEIFFFLWKRGGLPNSPIHLLHKRVISFFGNRTCYDQTHKGLSHTPQTAGGRCLSFLLKAAKFLTFTYSERLLLQINEEAENGRVK